MGLVERVLFGPAALRLVDGPAHRRGNRIRVHDHHTLRVSRGPADGLDQGRFRAQKALFVRVQNRHQGDLRQVQAFPEQVNAHQHVKGPQA